MQPQELGDSELTHTKKKVVLTKRMTTVLRKVAQAKNFLSKELSEILHDIENSKDEKLEADLNLQIMTICQDREKMLVPYHELKIKKANTVKITCFYKKNI